MFRDSALEQGALGQGARLLRFVLGRAGPFPREVSEDMPAKTVKAAIDELRNAVQSLEIAIDGRFDKERDVSEFEGEVRRVNEDRSRLAQELDQSQFRANRLEEVNREVSRRLVTAMETIRAVLDR